VRHDRITAEVYFVPSAQVLLAHLALQTLVLIMAGRVVGRGGVAWMMPVVYNGRALPLAWQGRRGKTGHLPADLPRQRLMARCCFSVAGPKAIKSRCL
jgi:hypothetical protein